MFNYLSVRYGFCGNLRLSMESRSRILEPLTDKFANEATDEELHELYRSLQNNAELRQQVNVPSAWWQAGNLPACEYNYQLLKKIIHRIDN